MGVERAQRGSHRGRHNSRTPHDRFAHGSGFLHRDLFGLHSKERHMLKQPAQARGITCGIAGPSDGVESEADAEKSSDRPVSYAMAAKIEEDPSDQHSADGSVF